MKHPIRPYPKIVRSGWAGKRDVPVMAISCFEVDKLPDLTLNKYQSLANTGVNGVLQRHENFLRQWHGICKESGTSLHLMYIYQPAGMAGQRLKLYILLQGEENTLLMLAPLLHNSPLSDFYTFSPTALPETQFGAGAVFLKKERMADIFNPLANETTSVHYVPKWEMNQSCRMYDLFRMMETLGQAYQPPQPCAFRLDLYPASLEQVTRSTLSPILSSLRGDNNVVFVRDNPNTQNESYADEICGEYENWLTEIETNPHFRINMYGFADSFFKAKLLLNAAGSEAISAGDYSIAAIKEDSDGGYSPLSRMGQRAENYCFYTSQIQTMEQRLGQKLEQLRSWSTTYCMEEVSPFFRLPALYDGENIELPKETAPVQIENGLYLGRDMHNYPVNFPLAHLPRHAFFTGMPGSGKTNTMLHLVTQLRKNHIPFLALEPAKKEYRSLLGYEENRDIFLFSPHLQSCFPLQMNPMNFPVGCRLSDHIDALLEVFEGTFLLEGPTRIFLSRSIQRAYEELGWDIEDVCEADEKRGFPSLRDVYRLLEDEINHSGYDGEYKGNVLAFLQNRLGGLMERHAGELFDTHTSTLPPAEWLKVSAIVELEVLGEQAKNFFVLMVCHYIFEALRADPNGGVDAQGNKMPVRHVVFIEEAHNIIASSQQNRSDSVDPKVSATKYILKMLAEVRALREAIVIADQLPTALASEVTKNTGLKLIHRLAAQDDRQQIGATVSASPLQLEQMASFTTGKALIHHEKTLKPFEVQIAQWIQPELDYDIADEAQLYLRLTEQKTVQKQIWISMGKWYKETVYPTISLVMSKGIGYEDVSVDNKGIAISTYRKDMEDKRSCLQKALKKWDRLRQLWRMDSCPNQKLQKNFYSFRPTIEVGISSIEHCLSDMKGV